MISKFDLSLVAQGGADKDGSPYVRCSHKVHEIDLGGEIYRVCWSAPSLGEPALWFASPTNVQAGKWCEYWEEHADTPMVPMVYMNDLRSPLHPQSVPVPAGAEH